MLGFATFTVFFLNKLPSSSSRGCGFVENRGKARRRSGIGGAMKNGTPVE
jgi:hypothetical protein